MKDVLSVSEAAEALGVSTARVNQLIRAGRIDATKFSGTWVVDKASVAQQRETVGGAGTSRAMAVRSIWGLASLVDDQEATGLTASALSKLRSRARTVQTVDQVRRWGERRYVKTLTLSVAATGTEALLADARTTSTGVSAVAALDAWDEVEVAVRESALGRVVADHDLDEFLAGDTRATVHVLGPEAESQQRRLIIALDLADSRNGRTRDLGRRQVAELMERMRAL